MENKVQYTVTMKDLISNAIESMEKKAKSLDQQFNDLVKGSIAAFGAMEAYNYLKGTVAAFDEAEQASAQLDATLRSTGNAANLSREALDAQAQSLSEMTRFDDDAVTGAQSLLGTFTNIKDTVYMDAIPAIADLATKMGTDLNGATIQVGKALNDPIKGITALTRVGVSFTEQQKNTIESLVKTGKTSEAQKLILAELNKEFGGSAEAAGKAGSGPLIILQNQLGNVTESIGGLVVELVSAFKPAILTIGGILKDVTTFLQDNKKEVKAVAVGIALGAVAFGIYKIAMLGSAAATAIMSFNMAALNAVIAANPIGIAVGLIVALGAGLYYAWEKSETFRKGVMGVWEVVKTYVGMIIDYFKNLGTIVMGVFTFDASKIKEGLTNMVDLAKGAGEKFAGAWEKGKAAGSASFAASQKAKEDETIIKTGDDVVVEETNVETPKGNTAAKATTINITIGNLVESFTVSTTNIQESTSKIREMVATALTDALNDSQIIAGG
jgi:cytochrome c556